MNEPYGSSSRWTVALVVRRIARAFRDMSWSICAMFARQYLICLGVRVGPGLHMSSFPVCSRHPGASIQIGANVYINNKSRENMAGISHRTVLVAARPGAQLLIGDHVGISGAVLYCCKKVVIEEYVNIGAGVRIYDTDFHPVAWQERRINREDTVQIRPVRICRDVWIGSNAMVLKGVTIGERSIVAAGAVVTSDVPSDCVVAGVPAVIVKRLMVSEPAETAESA
jgi:acetyltransferase-like isoleucine patch superfamily enzyme